ncbi:MAG: RnfABCDGE type electron transport complex subunit G [Lachnospiraceae bacterium]|nr:RnfABCDGE type electron transport complex subunit G [Lachnospiraceae bacterium]
MKKDVKVMLKEAFVLFSITLISGLLLGFVYQLTKDPIAKAQELAIQNACKAVFSDAASFELISAVPSAELKARMEENGVRIEEAYEAYGSDGSLIGHVISSASSEGYGGDIVLYLGVDLEGKLRDVSILDISETAGLGMNAESVLVPQFHDKAVSSFTYTKTGSTSESEIDAISGATITTKAFTNAVNYGLEMAAELRKGGDAR